MASACRLCLSSTANHYETIAAIEEKYFQLILPEIDIELVQSPMFCQSCVELLQTTYSFKNNCIETEKMLKFYASSCGGGNILLSDVLENQFWEKYWIQSGYNGTEAACSKDIKTECDNDNFACDLDLAEDDLQNCTEIEIKLTEKEINFGISHQSAMGRSLKNTCYEGSNDESNKDLDRKLDCKRPFQCKDCGKSFRKMKLLIDHIKNHYEQPRCPTCGKAFSKRYGLRRHLIYVHKVGISDKVQLDAQNIDKDKLEDSLQQHLELYKGVIDVTGGESSDEEELQNRPFKCNLCEKSYNIKKCLQDHIRTHFVKSDCKLCGKRMYNVSTAKRHLLAVHQIGSSDDLTWRDHISVVVDAQEMEQALKEHNKKEMRDDENKSVTGEEQLDRPYKCNTCKKSFPMKKALHKHIRVHFTKSTCKLCGKGFSSKVNTLKRHLLAVHQIDVRDDVPWRDHITVVVDVPEMEKAWKLYNIEEMDVEENNSDSHEDQVDRPFICNLCKKAYQMAKDLRHHIRIHFTKSNCNVCGKGYYNVSVLKRHLHSVHQIDLGDDVTWRDNITVVVDIPKMEQAMKEHALENNSKLIEMDGKNEVGSNGGQLESMDTISTASELRKYTCETCGKQFGQKTAINKHKRTHLGRKFKCNLCQKEFKSKLIRQRHISACHLGIRPKRNLERKYICNICEFSTTYRYNLAQHMRIHTGERPFRCNLCDKTFTQGGTLYMHKRTVHTTDRLFTCEYCSKSFNAKGTLTKHILAVHLAHKVVKKYTCNHCGKKYRLPNELNSHLKWHLSDRAFSCDVCGKTFVTKHGLEKHSIIHFAEKEHKCHICGKGFHYKYNVKIHMKVHGIVT